MSAEFAYDYDFSAAPKMNPNHAPKRNPKQVPNHKPNLRKLENEQINLKENEKAANIAVAKFFAVVALCIAAMAVVCFSYAQVRDEKLTYKSYQKQLAIYQSQQNEIDAKLGTLISADKISKIAVEKLGMVKLSEDNKIYVSSNTENQILVSAEK